MTNVTISQVLNSFRLLSSSDQKRLKDLINSAVPTSSLSFDEYITDIRYASGRNCLICKSEDIVRFGKDKNGNQRYKCKTCGKIFTIKTNSLAHNSKKNLDVWTKYIDCMMDGLSVRESASRCQINKDTAFNWRHKILNVLQSMAKAVHLDGIIEADETYFPISYKGNHKNDGFVMPRYSRHRGKSIHSRGLSREQMCVPCAVNREGLSIAIPSNTGRPSANDIQAVFSGRIKPESVLCTDTMNSYRKFAEDNRLQLIQMKTGREKKGIYHIQHINSYHNNLKHFMDNFRGVATKYLSNYLVWNNFVNYSKETWSEKQQILKRFVFSTLVVA